VAQVQLLTLLPKNQRILLIGGGTGWILPELIRICQPSEIVYLEKSAQMLSLSQKQVPKELSYCLGLWGEEKLLDLGQFDLILPLLY
jgi:ubiquinone/menaquinone biosynthesis C-methylase UbiE